MTTVSWSPSGQLLMSGSPADSNLMVGCIVFMNIKVFYIDFSLFTLTFNSLRIILTLLVNQ